MSTIIKPERETQNRVVALFRDTLNYRYLGNRSDRPVNSNIDEDLLAAHLVQSGHTLDQIGRAIHLLRVEAENPNRSLYDNNKAVYSLLRYGVPVKTEAGQATETVRLIDWEHPEHNDFVIVEEVTLRGNHERRPDLVLYVNGIAVAVLELKKSCVSISEGIRQLLSNQSKEFNHLVWVEWPSKFDSLKVGRPRRGRRADGKRKPSRKGDTPPDLRHLLKRVVNRAKLRRSTARSRKGKSPMTPIISLNPSSASDCLARAGGTDLGAHAGGWSFPFFHFL